MLKKHSTEPVSTRELISAEVREILDTIYDGKDPSHLAEDLEVSDIAEFTLARVTTENFKEPEMFVRN